MKELAIITSRFTTYPTIPHRAGQFYTDVTEWIDCLARQWYNVENLQHRKNTNLMSASDFVYCLQWVSFMYDVETKIIRMLKNVTRLFVYPYAE